MKDMIIFTTIIRVTSLCMYSVCFSIFIEFETITFQGSLSQADFAMMLLGMLWVIIFLSISWYHLNVQK